MHNRVREANVRRYQRPAHSHAHTISSHRNRYEDKDGDKLFASWPVRGHRCYCWHGWYSR